MGIRRMRRRARRLRFALTARFGGRCGGEDLPSATVILLSYLRPQNMNALVGQALRLRFAERVIVSNNNPDVRIRDWVKRHDDRLTVIEQGRRRPASVRLELARDAGADHFISLDDDLFLYPEQIEEIYRRYLAAPEVAHGVQGTGRAPTGEKNPFRGPIRGDAEVDIIHRVYVFSRAHVAEWFRLLRSLGTEVDDLHNGEDILLSFAGRGRPGCHDIGDWLDCDTSERPGIALWRGEGFNDRRAEIYERLAKIKPR